MADEQARQGLTPFTRHHRSGNSVVYDSNAPNGGEEMAQGKMADRSIALVAQELCDVFSSGRSPAIRSFGQARARWPGHHQYSCMKNRLSNSLFNYGPWVTPWGTICAGGRRAE
jgi:hypothetical protein